MPAFVIKDTELLSAYFHGMQDGTAFEIWSHAKIKGTTYAALRYKISRNGKVRPAAMALYLTVDMDTIDDADVIAHVVTDEYHPRKNGKAEMTFDLDWTYNDND